jgi:hypothetical protein
VDTRIVDEAIELPKVLNRTSYGETHLRFDRYIGLDRNGGMRQCID